LVPNADRLFTTRNHAVLLKFATRHTLNMQYIKPEFSIYDFLHVKYN